MKEFNTATAKTKKGNVLNFELKNNALYFKVGNIEHRVKEINDREKVVYFEVDSKIVGATIEDENFSFQDVKALFNTTLKTNRKLIVLGKEKWDGEYWKNKDQLHLGDYFQTIINGVHVYCCYQYAQ